jgi:ABC-2 type transport system permease protein
MIGLFVTYHLRCFRRFFRSKSPAGAITVLLFVLVLAGTAVGVFLFARAGFLLIDQDDFLREAASLYVYELFLLTVVYMVIVSAAIGGVFRLLRGRNDAWLMATPGFCHLPFWRGLEIFVASLWPFLVIAIPALAAQMVVFKIGLLGFVFLSLLAVLLVAFAAAAVLGMMFLGARLSPRRLIWFLVFLAALFGAIAWRQASPANLFEIFGVTDFTAAAADPAPIVNRFRFFPTHPAALTVLRFQQGLYRASLAPLFSLLLWLSLSLIFLWRTSARFLPIWQTLQEGRFEARGRIKTLQKASVFPRRFKTPLGALFEKEVLLTFRNAKNLLWLGFLLSLWLIIAGFHLGFRQSMVKYSLRMSLLPQIVQALQLVILIYFISAFVLRFALPSFSAERRTAWIIGVAPLDAEKLFYGKCLFFAAVSVLLGAAVSLINALIFEMSWGRTAFFVFHASLAAAVVTLLGLAVGAIFPNFETDDPEAIGTSLPGLAFVFASLSFGVMGAAAYYWYLAHKSFVPLGLFDLTSLLLMVLVLRLTPRFLARVEFVKITAAP